MILVGDWAPALAQVDLRLPRTLLLANLEGPVLDSEQGFDREAKAGPHLYSANLPRPEGRVALALANNHMMDYGIKGLIRTFQTLAASDIPCCGAGMNLPDARAPMILDDDGVRIGVLSCCEAQFGIARQQRGGCAEFGPWVYPAIDALRRHVDFVIVSVHAAVEDAPWPSPFIRALYRSYIDAGADVVHGHHAHVPQGYEAYRGGLVFYGLGNFAVDPRDWSGYPNALWSLGVDLDVRTHPPQWERRTFEIRRSQDGGSVRVEPSDPQEALVRADYLESCNRPLADPVLFEAVWQEVAMRAYDRYGAGYMGFCNDGPGGEREAGRLRRWRDRMATWPRRRTRSTSGNGRQPLRLRYHMLACESHRQMLTTALGIQCGEIEDVRTEESRRLADANLPWQPAVA